MPNKKIILIIGAHRSGTSALTGVCSILGGYLGENIMKATPFNIKGHFENNDFCRINENILKSINSSWNDLKTLNLNIDNFKYKQELKDLIITHIEISTNIFILKDPRICVLYPFYELILQELELDTYHIISERNETEIVKSLMRRNNISYKNASLITNKHLNAIDKYIISKYNYLKINFNDLIHRTYDTIDEIIDYIPELNSNNTTLEKIDIFLEKKLKHF